MKKYLSLTIEMKHGGYFNEDIELSDIYKVAKLAEEHLSVKVEVVETTEHDFDSIFAY